MDIRHPAGIFFHKSLGFFWLCINSGGSKKVCCVTLEEHIGVHIGKKLRQPKPGNAVSLKRFPGILNNIFKPAIRAKFAALFAT